jgi:hypothetical protein
MDILQPDNLDSNLRHHAFTDKSLLTYDFFFAIPAWLNAASQPPLCGDLTG